MSNDLSGIVTVEEINYSEGIGFAYLKLKIDGVEAETLLSSAESDTEESNTDQEPGENPETEETSTSE